VASSASCYDRVENISVLAVVEPERKLVETERQILHGNLVIAADDSTLEQRPEQTEAIRQKLSDSCEWPWFGVRDAQCFGEGNAIA
jgi:SepF-like predicted cell division protein (DUF552 family)